MLIPSSDNNFELLIENNTGESFASISAVSRILGDNKQTITNRSVKIGLLKEAEILTPAGLRSVKLLNEDQIYELAIQSDKPQAKDFLRRVSKAGIRLLLHELAGYQVKSELPGKAEEKLEGYRYYRDEFEATAKQKCYNEAQGQQVFNMTQGYWKDMMLLDSYDYVTREQALEVAVCNLAATNRLLKEEDKSLQRDRAFNMAVKAGRHGVYATKGVEAVPIDVVPKCERKLIESGVNPLTGNPSSKMLAAAK